MLLTQANPRFRILVTGAAGLIGGALCGELASRGHAVVALINRSRELIGLSGEALAVAPLMGEPEQGRIAWLAGDIREPGLGLTAPIAPGTLDCVAHCAAVTSFAAAPGQHRAINVVGTANVLAFARAALVPSLVHVSTAYVCGERCGAIAEAPLTGHETFANAYEASKADGEALVAKSGLGGQKIARPSIVVGDAATGAIGRFDNIYGLLRLIGAGRIRVLPAAPGATLDLVPIDHVVGGLVDLVERPEATGTFHLVSGDPLPVATLAIAVYPGFEVPRLVLPGMFDPADLPSSERALYLGFAAGYATYLRRHQRFEAENLRTLSGRTCPPTGADFLCRLVRYAVEAGYLRPDAHLTSG